MKRVTLSRIVLNERTPEQTIFLKEEGETGRVLPVIIGIFEANAIQMGLYKIKTGRPMTHDLLLNVFDALGLKVQRILIDKLQQSTFHAQIILKTENGIVRVDSRPSDAVALATRIDVPLFVDDDVFDTAAIDEIEMDTDND